MTIKNNRCDELGVCQGQGPDQCPDCKSWGCDLTLPPDGAQAFLRGISVEELHPQPGRRATDRAPQPTFPFAPGVIQGPRDTPLSITMEDDGIWCASWQRELVAVVALVALAALLGAGVARWLA